MTRSSKRAPMATSDSKWIGMPGMHGTYEANMTMHHCDVLVAIGARFDDRVIGNPKHFAQISRKIIHIDIDPSSISKRVKVDVPIVGDVGECMSSLLDLLEASFSAGAGTNSKALQSWWAGPGRRLRPAARRVAGRDARALNDMADSLRELDTAQSGSLADISHSQKRLGYRPSHLLEDGLRIALPWFIENPA